MSPTEHKELADLLISINQKIVNTKILVEAFGVDEASEGLLYILDDMERERRELETKLNGEAAVPMFRVKAKTQKTTLIWRWRHRLARRT